MIAMSGIASRRKAEELIVKGLVEVNGCPVHEPACEVDPDKDKVSVAGQLLSIEKKVYFLLNKPAGCISSVTDSRGRKTVVDLLTGVKERVFPVGRLDYDTEGLIILTNDGDFANLMTHPRYEVPRVYQALVKGCPRKADMKKLAQGIMLDGKKTAPARGKILKRCGENTLVELEIHEGRKHQVKNMMKALGYPVLKLRRVAFGSLQLGGLKPGEFRRLSAREVNKLIKEATGNR